MSDAYAQEQAATKWPAIWLGLHGAIAVIGVLLLAFLVLALKASGQGMSSWALVGVIGVLLAIQISITLVGQEAFVVKAAIADEYNGQGDQSFEFEGAEDPLNREATVYGWQEV